MYCERWTWSSCIEYSFGAERTIHLNDLVPYYIVVNWQRVELYNNPVLNIDVNFGWFISPHQFVLKWNIFGQVYLYDVRTNNYIKLKIQDQLQD